MKRVLPFLLCIILCLQSFAQADNSNAVSFVSYEQSWLDSHGTIALKNNTSEDVHNVSFVIKYLDMKNNPLDYEEYSYRIDIAPGMTKKLDIPAYEHSRNYHYYKTKDDFGNPAFKIEYELKGYNITEGIDDETSDNNANSAYDLGSDNTTTYVIIAIIIALFALSITIGLYVLVAVLAQKRDRSVVVWLLLSFIATPLLIIIILLCIGKADNYNDLQ